MLGRKGSLKRWVNLIPRGKNGEIEGEISAEQLDIDCRVGRGGRCWKW